MTDVMDVTDVMRVTDTMRVGIGAECGVLEEKVHHVKDLRLQHFEDYRLVISSSPLYSSPDDEFSQVNKITALLYQRQSWSHLIYMIVREAANLYYSRIKITQNQTAAKADMVYLIREARHMGVALGLDTLKYTSIDSDIRAVTDYLMFKAQGIQGLPHDLYWIYKFIDPGKLRVLKPNEFVCLHRGGALGLGVFSELKWHKQEKEHILNTLGISCEYGEEIDYGRDMGSFKQLGDQDHTAIIKDYIDNNGMNVIAEARGISSGTVYNHINYHNDKIKSVGTCDRCNRVGSEHAEAYAQRY